MEVEFLSVVTVVSVTLAQFAVVIKVFQPDAPPNREMLSPASKGCPSLKVSTAGFAFVAEDSAADFGRISGNNNRRINLVDTFRLLRLPLFLRLKLERTHLDRQTHSHEMRRLNERYNKSSNAALSSLCSIFPICLNSRYGHFSILKCLTFLVQSKTLVLFPTLCTA